MIGSPFLLIYAKNPTKYYEKLAALRRWISLAALYTVGIRIHVTYDAAVDWSKNYILCANHTSILDVTILNYLCQSPFSFIGKVELLKNPVTRVFFKTIDIPVKRDSKISSFKAYKRALTLLQEGKSLAIFPEGGIEDVFPPRLQPFKSGAFRMACESHTPILPIVIQNAWQILWDEGKDGARPGVIRVNVLAPIAADGTDLEAFGSLESEVYHKMHEAWSRCNK